MHKIICLVGPSGAGKDEVMRYIHEAVPHVMLTSLSAMVRQSAQEVGIVEPTRELLQFHANERRKVDGNGVFGKILADTLLKTPIAQVVVNGVRHPLEIDELQTNGNILHVLGVDAPQELRFERVAHIRKRDSDPKTWDDFVRCDVREQGSLDGTDGQQNLQCLSHANRVIHNDRTLAHLKVSTLDFLREIGWIE